MDIAHLSFEAILEFFGVVAIIGGGLKIILEAITPFKRLVKRQDEMDKKLDNDNKRFKEIEKNYKELKDMLNANSKLLIQLTEHILSGNDTDKLKQKRDELLEHVIEK